MLVACVVTTTCVWTSAEAMLLSGFRLFCCALLPFAGDAFGFRVHERCGDLTTVSNHYHAFLNVG